MKKCAGSVRGSVLQKSKIVLKNIFLSADKPDTAAAHFVYLWTMNDGIQVHFECVDVFDFALQSDKILSLTIIYDTYHTKLEEGRDS